jgi:hemolysin activation/secretion protein
MVVGLRLVAGFVLAASLTTAAGAQVIPPGAQPGREREQFTQPPAPLAKPGGPAITLPSTVAPKGAEKVMLRLRGVHIVGSTVYSAKELAPLYDDLLGEDVPLTAVYDLAQRITAKYGSDGYVLSRAIVPPQQLNPKGAIVEIQVVEGYIDNVVWPAKLARYRDFFSHYAAKIIADRPANIRTVERYLLLAGDLPGLKFSTNLKPSKTKQGAATLIVEVVEKRIDANAHVDNRGTTSRGPFEYYGSVAINNPFGWHDALTLTYAGVVPTKELNYAAFNYRQVLTPEGFTFFADGSYAWGRPGTIQLDTLQYRTLGPAGDAGFSYPWIRSRERNLTLSVLGFGSDNESYALGAPFTNDRLRGFRVRVDSDFADQFLAVNQFYAIFSQGIEGLGSTKNGDPLASRPGGYVNFTKVEAFFGRTQPLFGDFSVYTSVYGQYAAMPLLVPEQCGYGGRFFGRAFDPSQFLGDSCVEASEELRYDIRKPPPWMIGLTQYQLYGFVDWGELYTRGTPFAAPLLQDGASAGIGVRLAWVNHINVDLSIAQAIDVDHINQGVSGLPNERRFFFIVSATY